MTIAIKEKYRVRAVVRKEQDIVELQRKSPAIASALAQDRLEFALIPDLLSKEAVSNALDGVTVVIHLASPLAVEVLTFLTFPAHFVHSLTPRKEQRL